MTDIAENETSVLDAAEEATTHAMKAFKRTIQALESACDRLEAAAEDGQKELLQDLKRMNDAYLFALKMQEKAREAGSERYGQLGSATLDLDAARAEIGVRLACLRSARTDRGVPGGTE